MRYAFCLQDGSVSQVSRQELEQDRSVKRAAGIVAAFLRDDEAYPYGSFIMREGISKTLAEEYFPLVSVAETLGCVRSLRLSPEAHQGPDGEIRFWFRQPWNVQITCASENYERALSRERMRDGLITGSGRHARDATTGEVTYDPEAFDTTQETRARIERIVARVRDKEARYRVGCDTLLVLDEPDGREYLHEQGFRSRVSAAIRELGSSHYARIYVVYGQVPERVL